ncbi:MAG: DUF2505 domain-containing protein [Pseudomonadales bacterium]|nr:DUF2505 domain-containing protein [Pseudomonadales bacterium]
MEIKVSHHYNADIDKVFKSFGDTETLAEKFAALGARNFKVNQLSLADASLELSMQREVPADAPKMLKKFLAEWNTLEQTESWTGQPGENYVGTFSVDIKGVPVTIQGRCDLKKTDTGCVNEVTVNIDCGIPLVGKKLAAFVAESSEGSMDAEYRYIKSVVEG